MWDGISRGDTPPQNITEKTRGHGGDPSFPNPAGNPHAKRDKRREARANTEGNLACSQVGGTPNRGPKRNSQDPAPRANGTPYQGMNLGGQSTLSGPSPEPPRGQPRRQGNHTTRPQALAQALAQGLALVGCLGGALVGLALAQGTTKAHQGLAQGSAKAWWCLGDETSFKKAGISNEIEILINSKVCSPAYTILITQLLAK